MTVSTTTTTISYTGDNATVNLPVPFQFDDDTDLEVIRRVTATGAETTLTITTDYTVTGGDGSTGTVQMVSAPNSSVTTTIQRATAMTQSADYRENDPFPADTHEGVVDKLTRIAQENRNLVTGRALLLPATEAGSDNNTLPSSVDRASGFLYFDANGTPGIAAATTDAAVSPFMETVLDDTSAAAARSTLGAANDSQVLKTGLQTIFFPVSSLTAPAANAPASGNLTAGNLTIGTKDYDASTREGLWGAFQAPKSWDLGNLTFQVDWGHGNTSTNFGVTWGFRAAALTDGENIANATLGTQVNVSDTGGTQNFTYQTAISGNVTVGSSPAASALVVFELSREPGDGNDTLAVDAKLVGLTLLMNVSAANDT